MPIKIQIPTPLREHTQGQATVQVSGTTVKESLEELCKNFGPLATKLFDKGEVRPHLNVYLNEEDIRYLDGLGTAVKDGDSLDIIPAVAGG